ncbi:MAG: NADH-quinone oxidoreductase subunit NuoE [Bacteroidota bacterium]
MEFKFSEDNLKRVEAAKKKYPSAKSAVMDLIYIAQEQNGYITNEVMSEIADTLAIDAEEVLGVVTFYTMYHTSPVGRFHVQVCTNVSCMLRGGYEILGEVENTLGIKEGEVTSDGMFSIEEVECMGSCGTAPMVSVNYDYYENLDREKIRRVIGELREKSQQV